jgi:hypothetical protein
MSIDIEQRLRAAWQASEALVSDLDDGPEPVVATRHRDWRAPLLAAAVVLAISIAAAFGFSRGSTSHPPVASRTSPPVASRTSTVSDAPPAAVRAVAQGLIRQVTVHRQQPVEWVLTTSDQWVKLEIGTIPSTVPRNVPEYVVQIRGDFDCTTCGTNPSHGSVLFSAGPVKEHPLIRYGFGLGITPYDLSKLGTVHTFQLN